MPDQMVDADERFPRRPCEALGHLNADEQRADEPGTVGHGNTVDVSKRNLGSSERRADDGPDVAEVISRRELWHHTSVG
jgi:hypothetical protein